MSAFFELHKDLPREGPGDTESLNWALAQVNLPASGRILDAACGPGADLTDLLAHVPSGEVVGVERHAPFVEAARRRAPHAQIQVFQGDMAAPPNGPYDLIWCAGALYFVGVEPGLSAWRAHLADGGVVVFSEPLFFTEDPSAEAVAFWGKDPVGHREDVLSSIDAAGYALITDRKLPDAAWEAYYGPQDARVQQLRAGADEALTKVLDQADCEARSWRALRQETGYGQFVVRRNP